MTPMEPIYPRHTPKDTINMLEQAHQPLAERPDPLKDAILALAPAFFRPGMPILSFESLYSYPYTDAMMSIDPKMRVVFETPDSSDEELRTAANYGPFSLAIAPFATGNHTYSETEGLFERIFEALCPGGAFVLVEHVITQDRTLNDVFAEASALAQPPDQTHLSIETAESLLRRFGFRHVEVFYRYFATCAWVAIKRDVEESDGSGRSESNSGN